MQVSAPQALVSIPWPAPRGAQVKRPLIPVTNQDHVASLELPRRSWRLACRAPADAVLQTAALEHYFPHEDADRGMAATDAFNMLGIAVAASAKSTGDEVAALALRDIWTVLQAAHSLSSALEATESADVLPGLVTRYIVEPLSLGRPVVVEGGYVSPRSSHYVALTLLPPDADGMMTMVASNRGEGSATHHTMSRRDLIQPFVARMPAVALNTVDVRNKLVDLLRMQQTSDTQHSGKNFYQALADLTSLSGGEVLLGKVGGRTIRKLDLPGQVEQIGGTCTLASNMGMLWIVLASVRYESTAGALSYSGLPSGDDLRRVRTLYDDVKGQLADHIFKSAKQLLERLQAAGETRRIAELSAELARVHEWRADQMEADA